MSPALIEKRIPGCRALWTDGITTLVARGCAFWGIDGQGRRVTPVRQVGSLKERVIGAHRLPRQLLRVGIHHLFPLADGGHFVVLKRRSLALDAHGEVAAVFEGYLGNKPGHRGVTVTPDGTIFFGEYSLNMHRQNPTSLYRSVDAGRTFEKILTFDPGDVRHIHFIQHDPHEGCIWLGTGDSDHESRLYRSEDNGDHWEMVGGGSQLWRAVGITVTPDALYWGTDAGSDAGDHPNYIMRFDRASRRLEQVQQVQGPCHGNGVLRSGAVLVSTGVEGGQNEADRAAHVWVGADGRAFREVFHLTKDVMPHIVQYGVIRFPVGIEQSDRVICTTYGLAGHGESVLLCRKEITHG